MYLISTILLSIYICSNKILCVDPPYGQLKVVGSHLTDSNGNPVILRGLSMCISIWGGDRWWIPESVQNIKCYWNSNIIRAAMGVAGEGGSGGYIAEPEVEYEKLKTVVDACIAAGIYVIIDWHTINATLYQEQAIEFFKNVSQVYGKSPNILYEIWNEPTTVYNWSTIAANSLPIIDAIRANDPNNVIIVPSPDWDGRPDLIDSPINRPNLVYALHFYAASHKDAARNTTLQAIQRGLPLFVSEYGSVTYSGNGSTDPVSTNKWWDILDQNNISYTNWCVADSPQGACKIISGGTPADLKNYYMWTESGRFINAKYQSTDQGLSCDVPPSPVPTSSTPCIYPWTQGKVNNKKCYRLSYESMTDFDRGNYDCNQLKANATLVSIDNAFDNSDILSIIKNTTTEQWQAQHSCYIGLIDFNNTGTYTWYNGDASPYRNWNTGYPKLNATKWSAAAMLSTNGSWVNMDWYDYNCYICQYVVE